jgi:hypothetical protein
MQLPSDTVYGDPSRANGRPAWQNGTLYNVRPTLSGRGMCYYYTCGNSVFHSANASGPLQYTGEKGSDAVKAHEKNSGLTF